MFRYFQIHNEGWRHNSYEENNWVPVAASRLISTFVIVPNGENKARISASEIL